MTFSADRPAVKVRIDRTALKQISIIVLLALGAALLMSPFGWRQFLLVGGFYLPELFVGPAIAIMLAFFGRSAIRIFENPLFVIWISLCVILGLLGVLMHGDFAAAYADFRCLVACGFVFVLMRYNFGNVTFERYVVYFSILTLFFNALAQITLPQILGNAKAPFPVVIVILGIYITATRGWFTLMIACFALGAYMAGVSFYRSNYLILALLMLGMISATFTSKLQNGRRPYAGMAALFAGATALIVYSGPLVSRINQYLRADESRYIQSIAKTTEFIDFLMGRRTIGADSTRVDYFSFIGNHIVEFMLPGGLGQKVLIDQWRSFWMPPNETMFGSSLDGGHLYLAAHFGLLFSVFLGLWALRLWLHTITTIRIGLLPIFLLSSLAVLLAFVSGTPFAQMSFAISLGLMLGVLLRGRPSAPNNRKYGYIL